MSSKAPLTGTNILQLGSNPSHAGLGGKDGHKTSGGAQKPQKGVLLRTAFFR